MKDDYTNQLSIANCTFCDHYSDVAIIAITRYKNGRDFSTEIAADIELNLFGCEFTNSIVRGEDGLMKIRSNKEIVFDHCIFSSIEGGTATEGFGIVSVGCTGQAKRGFVECVFDGCSVSGSYGMIYGPSGYGSVGELSLEWCKFLKCDLKGGIVQSNSASGVSVTALLMKECDISGCQSDPSLLSLTTDRICFDSVQIHDKSVGCIVLEASSCVNITACTFNGCESRNGDFIKISSCTLFVLIDASKFEDVTITSADSTSGLHCLSVSSLSGTSVSDCHFSRSSPSSSGFLSVASSGEVNITDSDFAGASSSGPMIVIQSHLVHVEGSDFLLSSDRTINLITPMLQFTSASAGCDLEFYNCCFHHNSNVHSSATPLYLSLSLEGNAAFNTVCFDEPETSSVSHTSTTHVDYGGLEAAMFGRCACFSPTVTSSRYIMAGSAVSFLDVTPRHYGAHQPATT